MNATNEKQKSNNHNFQKDYDNIIKKATEFNKLYHPPQHINFNTQEVFKKFSLYTDTPSSITSFNTDAGL